MPYLEKKYRKLLDPHVDVLVEAILAVRREKDLDAVLKAIESLALAIKRQDEACGYWGAFAGLLNYSCTETLLRVLPEKPKIRYWKIASVAGLAAELAHIFIMQKAHLLSFSPLSEASGRWFEETPFGKEHAFVDILIWTFANLGLRVIPENSRAAWRLVAGVFRNIDLEFYRRIGILYEDLKISENGDVMYKEYVKAIRAEMKKKRPSLR